MLTLGVNLGRTNYGKALPDGGSCLIQDLEIIAAVAEERVTRRKHAGGYSHSLKYCLAEANKELKDIDLIVVSSCVEPLRNVDQTLGFAPVLLDKIRIISHHLSHAYSAYWVSPFDEAIIMVIDAGGNYLEPHRSSKWWEHQREQHSYYIGRGSQIELYERQFDKPFETGFGELYRCFTKYLGFLSGENASKLMSLAAYGRRNSFSHARLFIYKDKKVQCLVKNFPPHINEMVHQWSTDQDIKIPKQRLPSEPITQHHLDLAWFVQNEFEEAMIFEAQRLYSQTGITNLCIAGGIGLNCVVHNRILEETPIENVFIQPAAGDTGQCLGNAVWGQVYSGRTHRKPARKFSVYLGKEYSSQLENILAAKFCDYFHITTEVDIIDEIIPVLTKGGLVGWFQGRSEFGPRALGNRSILADPRFVGSAKRLARSKSREWFRPFAPSIIEQDAPSYFKLVNFDYSYMTLVAQACEHTQKQVPSVVHVDGTSRIHVVSQSDNPGFYDLLCRYKERTGLPMLINTSFNMAGEPLVESIDDALKCFRQMELDCLVIGKIVIQKLEHVMASRQTAIPFDSSAFKSYDLTKYSFKDMIEDLLNANSEFVIAPRTKFGLLTNYWDWILKGKKTTTIRYRPNAVDIPLNQTLPVILSATGASPLPDDVPVGHLEILSVDIKQYAGLVDTDAVRDGFQSTIELKQNLEKFYGPIDESEWISIYHIRLPTNRD